MRRRVCLQLGSSALAVMALTVGCGGGSGSDGSGDSGSAEGSASASAEGGTGSASAEGGTSADGSTQGEGDGDGDGDGDGTVPKFDIKTYPDASVDCECGSQLGFSYIWIANSTQGTVTKLNTESMVEEGRYLTRPDGVGSPSRTSVALSGRAVAVANRSGGVVKVLSRPEDCDTNKNGQPGLQTSGDDNYLAWGQDDCIDWFVPFNYSTQRPVAWAPGILDQKTCEYDNEKVWTAGCNAGSDTWAKVSRIGGDDGDVEFTLDVNGFECSSLSPYGGAVNAAGDFWFTNLVPGNDRLGFVDYDDQTTQVWNMPITPYGMTVDHNGNPWIASWSSSQNASAAKFDVQTETWSYANDHVAHSLSGIQEDAFGRMWMNYWTYDGQNMGTGGLVYIDMETMAVSQPFDLGCQGSTCRGMSVDLNGMIWSTSQSSNTAFRFDPDTQMIDTYANLVGPYTYSDMTGWGIQSATCGPQG